MAKVKVNGTEHQIDKFKFKSLKRSWPHMSRAKTVDMEDEDSVMAAVDAGIAIIAIGLNKTVHQPAKLKELLDQMPEEDKRDIDKREAVCAEWMQEELDADEMLGLSTTVHQIMVESGMIKADDDAGEPGKVQPPSPSTETSTE